MAAEPSSWLVIGRRQDVERFAAWSQPPSGPVLTDDFSDVMRLLRFP